MGSSEEKQPKKEEKEKYAKAPPAIMGITTKVAKASLKDPAPSIEEESKEEEEEVATYLGGGDPQTGHFTIANGSLSKDN